MNRTTMSQGDKIESVKEVCTLLLRKGKSKSERNVNTVEEIVEWFDILEKSLDDDDPLLTVRNGHIRLVSHLLQLLRECLLSHRWQEAVKVLHGLSRHHRDTAPTIWKTGMGLLYTSAETNGGLIDQLVNQLKWISDLNAKDVILEYIMYLLDQGRLEDVGRAFKNVPKLYGHKKAATDRSDYTGLLFEAYHGLVWYVEWLNAKNKMKNLEDAMTGNVHLQGTAVACNYEKLMRKHFQKAVTSFQCLTGKIGIWDIFITKHVELLEYYGEIEQCQFLLEQYIQCNSENPNSHKYLYEFYTRNNFSPEKIKDTLKGLAKHVPSDSLVLDLCEMLFEEDDLSAVLLYMFNLLDYSVWQFEEKPWSILSRCLLNVVKLKRPEMIDCLQEQWSIRSSWWPAYHFTYCGRSPSQHLLFSKVKCASVLKGPGNEFSSKMKEKLNKDQKKELLNLEFNLPVT